jgi:hypothetical protein
MDPGQTISFWPVLVEVPDTAAAGDVTFLSAFNLGPDSFGMNTTIHVLPSTGAGARGASALAFSPPLPNPAASGVHFGFQMPEPARVALEIFDVSGARLRTLTSARLEAGPHSQDWNLRDDANRPVAAGVYLSRLTVGTWSKTRRVAVIR